MMNRGHTALRFRHQVARLLSTCVSLMIAYPFLAAQDQPQNKVQAVQRLVDRETASVADPKRIPWGLIFAIDFAPEDESIKAKFNASGDRLYMASNSEFDRARAGLVNAGRSLQTDAQRKLTSISDLLGNSGVKLPSAALGPAASEQTELVNLRMLLDERLVGDLRFVKGNLRHGSIGLSVVTPKVWNPTDVGFALGGLEDLDFRFFLTAPSLTTAAVEQAYGPPSSAWDGDRTKGVGRVLSYGRISIVAAPDGQISYVFYFVR